LLHSISDIDCDSVISTVLKAFQHGIPRSHMFGDPPQPARRFFVTCLHQHLLVYGVSGFKRRMFMVNQYGQGPCGGGPFCDHPSGPQQYFLTKLPTEIQFLGSRPAARREVCTVSLSLHYCNSTLGYGRQVLLPTKKKNSPPADRRRLPTMAFGC
jgi:hypothetical protein